MAIVKQAYEYKDVYVSLLKYLGEVAARISAKYNLPALSVINLDGYADLAKLPEGDFIFVSDWTLAVDGNSYGDTHNLLIGFGVVNDPNLMKLETKYLNELMSDVARRKPCRKTVDIMKEAVTTQDGTTQVGTTQVGVLVFSDDYETMSPRVTSSRTLKSVMVTMLSPQRLLAETGGTNG